MMTNNKVRILIVDDKAAIRRFLQISLAAQGYTILETTQGLPATCRFDV